MQRPQKEVSCYSSSVLMAYARQHGFDMAVLFDGVEEHADILSNSNEWTVMKIWLRFMSNFERAGGNLYNAGIDITENQVSHFQLLFLKVFPLSVIIAKIPDLFETSICKTVTIRIEHKERGVIDIIYTPKPGSPYSTQACDFDRGCTFATLNLKKLRNLDLTEVTCAARSDASECRYRITWTPDPPLYERLKNIFLFRISSQQAILAHMEETYSRLQDQYKEMLGIKDFYSHIMANMNEGILWLDKDGKISFANNGFSSIVQHDRSEDVIGGTFADFLVNDAARASLAEIYLSCQNTPQVPKLVELQFITSKHEERFGQVACLWVDSTAQQKPGFLLSIRDITDKRTIQNKLYAVENRYRALYENSPAIIVGIDKQGKILYANPAMVEQCGYTEKELTGMHFGKLVAPPDLNTDADAILSRLSGRVGLQETHYRTKEGDWKSVALATFPLFNDTWEEIGLGAIGVDVTETKRLNELLVQTQRMDLLGQMAGGLAHDFKNLLAVVSGYGKLIGKISTEVKVKEFANNILLANERAYSLTKNLLTFSRGEVVKDEPFVVNEVAEEVKKLLPAILGSRIRFTADLSDQQFIVKGDAGKIHQCLLNLCINARDALAESEGSVTMQLLSDDEAQSVVVKIQDTGPGIPPDIIARIFDPFFTTKKKGEGTGLGLSVVYGIVKSHGGDITVDSRPGDGATFTIKLPLLQMETEESDVPSISDSEKAIVIVIDTDVVFRNYCSQILGHQGYPVLQYPTVQDAAGWLTAHGSSKVVLLLPATCREDVRDLPGLHTVVKPLWIVGEEEVVPGTTDLSLQRPFPPAALMATVRETVRQNSTQQ